MKCLVLFSRKNKKNINNLSSAESAHNVVSVKIYQGSHQLIQSYFQLSQYIDVEVVLQTAGTLIACMAAQLAWLFSSLVLSGSKAQVGKIIVVVQAIINLF